jgi:flavin reductase (DIM6/NTAB) family NADH-FMN oxidoreductase RutF
VHATIDPAILYFGTPVVLVSTRNPDGSANLAPISSAWWLGRSCLLGFGARSHTPANILREGECVINLPSVEEVDAVNRLAKTTGSDPVPPHKQTMGYRHERDRFAVAGLTPLASDLVAPPRVAECPVHLEAVLVERHPLEDADPFRRGMLVALEMRIERVHVAEAIRMPGTEHRIDPERWRPLMMSFCEFFGLGAKLRPSTLATIPEEAYRPRLPRESEATDRLGLEAVTEAGDHRPALGDRLLHRGQRERRRVALPAVPDLGDPDGVGVRRVFRDDIAQASGHLPGTGEQDLDQRVALPRSGLHLADQSVHSLPLLGRDTPT